MLKKNIAAILISSFFLSAIPAFATDEPPHPGSPMPQQPPVISPAPQPAPTRGKLTSAGSALKGIGIGLMGAGVGLIAVGATRPASGCQSNSAGNGCIAGTTSAERAPWYGGGGIAVGTGVIFFLVSRTRREH